MREMEAYIAPKLSRPRFRVQSTHHSLPMKREHGPIETVTEHIHNE